MVIKVALFCYYIFSENLISIVESNGGHNKYIDKHYLIKKDSFFYKNFKNDYFLLENG